MSCTDIPLAGTEREIRIEMMRQNYKWGDQSHHPDGTGPAHGDPTNAKIACQQAFAVGLGTWRHILAEEIAEAFAERDPAALRGELVQVAAVARQWIEAIDRREARR